MSKHKHSFVSRYTYGDILYVKSDPYRYKHQVVGFFLSPGGWGYSLQCGDNISHRWPFEVTDAIDEVGGEEVDDED